MGNLWNLVVAMLVILGSCQEHTIANKFHMRKLKEDACGKSSSYIGTSVDMFMVSNQLRGTIVITSDCSFRVDNFEVAGIDQDKVDDLVWFASSSLQASSLSDTRQAGVVIAKFLPSDLAQAFSSAGSDLFVEMVSKNVMWDRYLRGLPLLGLYNLVTKSFLGYANFDERGVKVPTMFDSCLQLSDRLRVRWSIDIDDDSIDIGLEGLIPSAAWMGFGPALPWVTNRWMPGSDVTAVGFDENDNPFVVDTKIDGYMECNYNAATENLTGTCDDFSLAGGTSAVSNSELVYAHKIDRVTLVRYKRALNTGDELFDIPITPGWAQTFIWAVGGTRPNRGQYQGPELKYHGPLAKVQFGEVLYKKLETRIFDCAPLPISVSSNVDQTELEDGFGKKFDKSVILNGDSPITLFWSIEKDPGTSLGKISFGVRCSLEANWVAIGFGKLMTDSFTYVAYIDRKTGERSVLPYYMENQFASGMKLIKEVFVGQPQVLLRSDGGLSFSFTKHIKTPHFVIDVGPGKSNPVIWAYGDEWSAVPEEIHVHLDRSDQPTYISFGQHGSITTSTSQPDNAPALPKETVVTKSPTVKCPRFKKKARCNKQQQCRWNIKKSRCLRKPSCRVFRKKAVCAKQLHCWWKNKKCAKKSVGLSLVQQLPTQMPTKALTSLTNEPTIQPISKLTTHPTSKPSFLPKPAAPPALPPATDSVQTPEDTVSLPPVLAPAKLEPSPLCKALIEKYIGDGWCDSQPSYNNVECAFDGGDCCDTSKDIYDCKDPNHPAFGQSSETGMYPAPRNPRYTVPERGVSSQQVVSTYNNFYEFGFTKDIYPNALRWKSFFEGPWEIEISGLVEKPLRIDVTELFEMFHFEERLYRHRCVEAWSITVPWIGFPLAKLVEVVKPLASAKYLRFETFFNTTVSPLQEVASMPFPYVEGLTVEEAMNEMTFLSVGQYQAPLPPQSGAPIRLTLPWKYGFKSIKSLKKITFEAERPTNFWNTSSYGREYGFWANVNPEVPHPRWSQATEKYYENATFSYGPRIPTLLYNGYEKHVASMYSELLDDPNEKLWM